MDVRCKNFRKLEIQVAVNQLLVFINYDYRYYGNYAKSAVTLCILERSYSGWVFRRTNKFEMYNESNKISEERECIYAI